MNSDVSDLILAINTLGDDLVGLELGVARGASLINILNNCSIKKLYGVDNWKPFADFLKRVPDGKPAYGITMETQEINRFLTYHTVKYSNQADKVKIIEKVTKKQKLIIQKLKMVVCLPDMMLSVENKLLNQLKK